LRWSQSTVTTVTGGGEDDSVKTLQRSSARFLAWAEQVEAGEDDGDHDMARERLHRRRDELAGSVRVSVGEEIGGEKKKWETRVRRGYL
jgi:hypothetical protein